MELTLDSAFSTGGLVGHFAYVLLIASMLMRQMVWLRLLVIASALVGILYSIVWLNDPVSSFWETLLVTVNVIQLAITWRQNSTAQFSARELSFVKQRLRGLAPGEQRRLLNEGKWKAVKAGETLIVEQSLPNDLIYIAQGSARITIEGHPIAECGAGMYVGEMSLVGDAPASATVTAQSDMEIWRISRDTLARFDRDRLTWLAVIEAGIARDMRRKLVGLNEEKLGAGAS